MIRLILIVIFAIIIFFASLIMLPVFWLIGKFNQDAKDRGSLRFVQGVFKVVLFLSGFTTTVKGLENLPKVGEAVLFVGIHHGFFDTIISYTYMKPRTGFVAKKEIEKVPLLNIWMRYEIGRVLKLDEIDKTADTAAKMLAASDTYKDSIDRFVKEYVYNLGSSASVGAKYIIQEIQKAIKRHKEQE